MLVPVHSAKASWCAWDAPSTSTPGANRSTHRPVMPSAHTRSAASVAPTVSAPRARPGENKHASSPRREPSLFPAAATTAIPRVSASARTAASSERDARPAGTPRESVSAAETCRYSGRSSSSRIVVLPVLSRVLLSSISSRFPISDFFVSRSASKCSATVSRPATTSDTKPFPSQSSTRTDTIAAAGARPASAPAASDATAVPWPKQSSESSSVSSVCRVSRRNGGETSFRANASCAVSARPPKSAWPPKTPESTTYRTAPAPARASRVARPSRGRRRWSTRSRPQCNGRS